MTAPVYMLRCARCRRERAFAGTLEQARTQLCGPCSVHSHYQYRLTVVGHQTPERRDPPALERIDIGKDVTDRARVLVLSALGEKA